MDSQARYLARLLCLPVLLLACSLPAQAQPAPPTARPLLVTAAPATKPKPKPASKSRTKRPPHYSKATLSAFQPSPAQLAPKADAAPGPAPSPATLLSPVVQKRPGDASPAADPLPVTTESDTPLAKLMETDNTPRPSSKSRQLPSQEEGLALSRATAMPVANENGAGVSEEAEAKVEKGLDTGPMNLRLKKQALQMSVEIPFK